MALHWKQIHLVYMKRAIVSAAFALLVALGLSLYETYYSAGTVQAAAIDRLKTMPVLGWFFGFVASIPFAGIGQFIDKHPAVVTGVCWGALLFLSLHENFLRRLLHYRLWPDRPFLFEPPVGESRERVRTDGVWAADPRRKLSPFVGRAEDFEWLNHFADSPKLFAWASLYGPPGRGKTRLAIEWCERLKGWDAGLLDADLKISELKYWRPRKKTIVVVDEAFQRNELANKLVAALGEVSKTAHHQVRILFLDHAAYCPELGEGTVAVGGAAFIDNPHRLVRPIADDDVARLVDLLAPETSAGVRDAIIAAAKGEPLVALMLWDQSLNDAGPLDVDRILAQKADLVLARAAAPGLSEALIQCAVAPPAPWPAGLKLDAATPIFPDAAIEGSDLPAYRPDLVGDRIVLRGLASMAENDQERLIVEAWDRAPNAAASSVRRMWLHSPRERATATLLLRGAPVAESHDVPGETSSRSDLRRRGKALTLLVQRPHRAAPTIRQSDKAWLDALHDLASNPHVSSEDRGALQDLIGQAYADCPMLKDLRRITAEMYQQALELVWALGSETDVDAATERLTVLGAFIASWPEGLDRALIIANGLFNASTNYGKAAEAGREEAWSWLRSALDDLRNLHRAFNRDLEIALRYANGLFNASTSYGNAAEAGREEAWSWLRSALDDLRNLHRAFNRDREIALAYAKGLFNASTSYGNTAKAAREEAWAGLHSALDDLRNLCRAFNRDPEIALRYANGLVNASNSYGKAAEAGREEAWAGLHSALDDLRNLCRAFNRDPEIALAYATGLFNACIYYGRVERLAVDLSSVRRELSELVRVWQLDPKIAPRMLELASKANLLSELNMIVKPDATLPTEYRSPTVNIHLRNC